MNPTLVIPSAEYIPKELQNIGKIPPLLYPLGKEILYDHLSKLYTNVNDIRIIGYEGFNYLENRFLNDPKITLIPLSQLTDLAHTVYEGLTYNDKEIILNFADTCVYENILTCPDDSFYYSEEYTSDLWTFFTLDNGYISQIIDKPKIFTSTKGMMFTGVFKFSNGSYLKKCLKESIEKPCKNISSFYSAILKYNLKYSMKPLKTENWHDIGHLDKYYNFKLEVEAREFNHISIDKNKGILRKTSDEKDKFIGEIQWYLKLPSDVEYCRPRIFSYSTSYANPFIEMEYYSYHTVHELFLYGSLRYDQWKSIFEKIAFVMRDLSRYTVKGDLIKSSLKEMYLEKTLSRLKKINEIPELHLLMNEPITINGIRYWSLNKICTMLKCEIPQKLCEAQELHIIHGDLCFTNILVDDNYSFVKLIDPRGKFGSYDIYGDIRYDLAKLFHSVDGKYDLIIKNKMNTQYDEINNSIILAFKDNKIECDLYALLQEVFSDLIKDQIKNIEFIESLLFLSMIPLHNENKNHQIAMIATGIQILNRIYDIREQ